MKSLHLNVLRQVQYGFVPAVELTATSSTEQSWLIFRKHIIPKQNQNLNQKPPL